MRIEEEVPAALDGERLDRIVSIVGELSRSDSSALIKAGGARVDGEAALSGKVRLRSGQSVAVDMSFAPRESFPEPDSSVDVRIVFADEHIIVVDKTAGLVVHPAPGHEGGTLVNGLLALYPEIASVGEPQRPGIVHRLDSGTTGLMVVARTDEAYSGLVAALSSHEVGRDYLALAWGEFESASQVVDAPIGRDPRDPLRMAVVKDGKWARTHVNVLRQYSEPAEVALVRCSLETGRTHQIRVHLAAIGHPVVGDPTYGGVRSSIRTGRPMLHAARLSLSHPVSGADMEWESAVPPDMSSVIDGLSGQATD